MPPDPNDANLAGCRADEPLAVFRHDLRTPLTTISGQMQLARRRVRRMDGPEETYLLARLAAIESAVLVLGERIERLGHDLFQPGEGNPAGDDTGAP